MKRYSKIVATLILSTFTILSFYVFSFADPPGPPTPPTISGTPFTTATVGDTYSFIPSSTNAAGFSITGTGSLPPGLNLSASNGTVSGTPTTAGTYGNIVITASNTVGSTSLPSFSIYVASSGGTGETGGGGTGGGGTGGGGTQVPVMEGWWLVPGLLAGVGLFARRRKE